MAKEIQLSNGRVALVSDDDFERISAMGRWTASLESRGTKWYAIRREPIEGAPMVRNGKRARARKRAKLRMHYAVLGLSRADIPDHVIDHVDGDSLNNQRENLEVITQEENMRRSPGWKRRD